MVSQPIDPTACSWAPVFQFQAALFAVVIIGFPLYAAFVRKHLAGAEVPEIRALYLPGGSVRAMLALLIVGSFLIVLAVGPECSAKFDQVIAAFGALSGAVIGFYFGARTSQKKDDIARTKL